MNLVKAYQHHAKKLPPPPKFHYGNWSAGFGKKIVFVEYKGKTLAGANFSHGYEPDGSYGAVFDWAVDELEVDRNLLVVKMIYTDRSMFWPGLTEELLIRISEMYDAAPLEEDQPTAIPVVLEGRPN